MTTSLGETCKNMREIHTARSRFLLCELSVTNAPYPKYPPQPVVRCSGYQPRDAHVSRFSLKIGKLPERGAVEWRDQRLSRRQSKWQTVADRGRKNAGLYPRFNEHPFANSAWRAPLIRYHYNGDGGCARAL